MTEYSFNENLRNLNDVFDKAHSGWVNHPDYTEEAKRRGAAEAVEAAEAALADDDKAFAAALEYERDRLTGYLEAALEKTAPKHGPDSVASMLGAKAAVDSGDAAVIIQAHDDAVRAGDHAALTVLERAGAAAMPEGLRDDFKERVQRAQEDRKPDVVKEREKALEEFEEEAARAEYGRSLMRSAFVSKLREYKRP